MMTLDSIICNVLSALVLFLMQLLRVFSCQPADLNEEYKMADSTDSHQDNLRAEYSEVSANIRWLADVRFKLLGLVPLATLLGGWFLTSDTSTINPLVSLFGLVITVALMIYNERNDQHYGELIGRAKSLERALGLDEGQFSQRSGTWLTLWGIKVNHSTAVYLIYQTSITVWFFGVLYPLLYYGQRAFTAGQSLSGPLGRDSIALISAIISVLAVCFFVWELGRSKKTREKEMRTGAMAAMGIIVGLPRQLMLNDEKWKEVREHLEKVTTLTDEEERRRREAEARNYILKQASPARYLLPDASIEKWDIESAANLAALLTHLPSRWYKTMYRQRMIENDEVAVNERLEGVP